MQESVKENRQKYIGGSDIPAIMGISHFKKRYDLLLEKAGIQDQPKVENDYIEYGNIMESKIRDFCNKGKKNKFMEDQVIVESDVIDYRYHSDGYDGKTVLEIKTTSQIKENMDEYKVYLVQLIFGMVLHNSKTGKLAVYKRPEDMSQEFNEELLTIYNVKISDFKDLVNEINEEIRKFKDDLQKVRENPWITEADLVEESTPTELMEVANKIAVFESKILEYKKFEESYKKMREEAYQLMEKYGKDRIPLTNGTTLVRVKGTPDETVMKFNEKKYKSEHEEEYATYLEETIKKGKAGYVRVTQPK